MLSSPFSAFSAMFFEEEDSFFTYDREKEARKLYVRKNAYMPPINNCRSIPANYKKKKEADNSSLICDKGGLLFAKRRCVSFSDRVEKFTYEV